MATTPPSPVSSWTLDAPAASGCATPAPALVWPGSTKAVTVQDASRGGALHLKLAQENETLQIWLEEDATKRQFYASLTSEGCKAIVKETFDPSNLLEMLDRALSANGEAVEGLSVSFEWHASSVTLILHAALGKWIAMSFKFPLAERHVSQIDRVERRIDDMDAAIKNQAAECEQVKSDTLSCMGDLKSELLAEIQRLAAQIQNQALDAKHAELNTWSLTVCNPYYALGSEGSSGHFAFSGNGHLVQDTDFMEKWTGVATTAGQQGYIVVAFHKPIHVNSVKLAAFPKPGWGAIADNNSLCIQTLSPGQNGYQTARANIPSTTQEETFPINKEIIALRLVGTYISISKLIFS